MKRLISLGVGWGVLLLFAMLAACPTAPSEEHGQESHQESIVISPDGSVERAREEALASEPTLEHVEKAPEASPQDASEAIPEPTHDRATVPEAKVESPVEQGAPRYKLLSTGGKACYLHVCVDAPPDATPERDVYVLIDKVANAPRGSIVPAMDVGPDNWKPTGRFFIEFDYSAATLPAGVAASQLRVAFVFGGKWVYVPTVVDEQQKKARGETTHFSVWGLVISGAACGRTADCFDAESCNGTTCAPKGCSSDADCATGELCKAAQCSVDVCFPEAELCNGIDDDCDGQIDNGLTRNCYSGPAGTAGTGICKAGTQTCNAGQWGVCLGEVTPGVEVCDTLDNDCNGQIDESCNNCRSAADCAGGEACSGGRCVVTCPAGQTVCAGGCTDLTTDDKNCGVCGAVCGAGESCNNGVCR